jgi:hypothetical protein
MASVSAFVALGSTHPNDNGFSPEWVAELWEGDRATWVFRPTEAGKRVKRYKPESPDEIFDAFDKGLRTIYRGVLDDSKKPSGLTLVVVVLDGSSLARSLRKFKGLKSCDVQLAPVSWSRTWSQWTADWSVSGDS